MANEKRLIDANDVYKLFDRRGMATLHVGDIDTIQRVDAVEVVRCKDCKHWKLIDSLNPHRECQIFYGLHDYGYLTGADDFCSYGERKDNGG